MPDPEFILLGDAIWTDFINTARGTGSEAHERLTDVAAYHRWVKAEKLTSDADLVRLGDVLEFRDHLTRLATALHENKPVPTASITAINSVLAATPGCHQLVRTGGRWRQQFSPAQSPAALDAIARSAAQTLANPSAIVRRCLGEDCSLFLVDTTTEQARVCCRPATCGAGLRIERRRTGR
jgi:predicted RNA-binding Zn ribbon-like protein